MKKGLFCFTMPHGAYCGGIASMINSYLDKNESFQEDGYDMSLFDYIVPSFLNKFPSKINNTLYGFLQRRALLKRLKQKDIDVLHIHTSRDFLFLKDAWLAKSVKRKRKIPVVLTVHVGAAETVFSRIGRFRKQSIDWLNRYVDRVIFLSKEMEKEFVSMGVEQRIATTVYNFHDLAPMEESDRLARVAQLQLLFVGAIHRDKGIMELMRALDCLPALNFHLDVCGMMTDSSIKEQFEALAKKMENRVTLHGYVRGKDKTALFERADVLLLPSYHEGMPLVILEAMASDCAVISTPVGATPEFMPKEGVAWVEVGSSDDIVTALTALSDADTLEIIQNANRAVKNEFSLKTHIEKLCRIYDEAVLLEK